MTKTVVILGAAFAGLHVAHYILKNCKDVQVIIVSKVSLAHASLGQTQGGERKREREREKRLETLRSSASREIHMLQLPPPLPLFTHTIQTSKGSKTS